MDRDSLYKQHIVDAISRIDRYLAGVEQEPFLTNDMLKAAVVRELEIIGEASKRFSEEFKQRTPTIPWKKVAGFRDVAIHDYMEVDLDLVWTIAHQDLPKLKQALSDS